MTNYQWALMEIGCLGKIISHTKCPENHMIITYEAYCENKKGDLIKPVMQVLFKGVSHHNDTWEIISGGRVTDGKFEVPFVSKEGYGKRKS